MNLRQMSPSEEKPELCVNPPAPDSELRLVPIPTFLGFDVLTGSY